MYLFVEDSLGRCAVVQRRPHGGNNGSFSVNGRRRPLCDRRKPPSSKLPNSLWWQHLRDFIITSSASLVLRYLRKLSNRKCVLTESVHAMQMPSKTPASVASKVDDLHMPGTLSTACRLLQQGLNLGTALSSTYLRLSLVCKVVLHRRLIKQLQEQSSVHFVRPIFGS